MDDVYTPSCLTRGTRTRRLALPALALLLMTLLAYRPATEAGFVWDDDANVTENLPLRSLDGLYSLWLEPGATTQYYPLVYTSFWLEYALWELEPFGYHLDNILLHTANAILLWRLLLLLGLPGAWLAAAVFALHPVHVESVAWVTERKNVLSGLFYLAAAWAYLRFVTDAVATATSKQRRLGYGATLALLLAAILSKSPTASLPAALLLVVWWKKGRLGKADVLPVLPLFAFGLPIALLTTLLEKRVGSMLGLEWDPSLIERFLLAGRASLFYLGKLLWPSQLTFVYPRWDVDDSQLGQYGFLLAALMIVAGLYFVRHALGRGPLVAVLYFGGTLAPVLGFLEIYFFRFSFVADHWQYLASIGPIALFVCGGIGLAKSCTGPHAKTGVRVLAVALLAVLGSLTWQQSRAYESSESLWRDSLAKNDASPMVHYNLALELEAQRRLPEAKEHYRSAIALGPEDPNAYNNLALMMAAEGNPRAAVELLREAVRVAPDFARARWNLAEQLLKQHLFEEAVLHFEHALSLPLRWNESQETLARSHVHFGKLLAEHERAERAREHFERALALAPGLVPARIQLAMLALQARDRAEAIGHLRAVLRQHPDHRRAAKLLKHARGPATSRKAD